MTKVSVIVPVYNSEKYLKRCLDSLLNQTLKELEIIVVNDGSTDNSLAIIQNYSKYIKIINHQKNKGIGKSRNDALKIATSEYIGYVDSDDYISPNMYEEYYNFAKKNNLDIVTGHYIKIINDTEQLFKNSSFSISNYQKNPQLINLIDLGPCNKIFNHNIIKTNNIQFEEKLKFEDAPFVLKNLYHANAVGHIDNAFYYYCVRDKSETTTIDKRTKDIFKILENINTYYKNINDELEYLNIREVTMYLLKQKNQRNKNLRTDFINYGYDFLNKNFPNWKNNKYYLQESFLKRIIKNNKIFLRFYCSIR